MRFLIAIVIIIGLMALAGWVVFDFGGNRASVEFRSDEVQKDTEAIVEQSEQLLKSP